MSAATAGTPAQAAQPEVTPVLAAEPEPPLGPEAQASQQARTTGQPVEVPAMTTETTRVVANPDGTFTAEIHSGPNQYRDTAGNWRPVSLKLEPRPDGKVAPVGHPRGLVISGAADEGDHDLATLAAGSVTMSLGWTGRLPEPELVENTATYKEVLPGIDLSVEATRTGFEQLLIVKNRTAASQVRNVTMPWRTSGVVPTTTPGGGLTLRNEDGSYAGHVPPAIMWDATVGPLSGDHLREARVPMTVTHGPRSTIGLDPDAGFLADPATTYPVTIDPSPTLTPAFDAFVQDNISSDRSTSKELKLGYVLDGGRYFKARSFIQWKTSALRGKNVTAATMSLWNKHSWNCTPREWQVWITDSVGTSTRWSKQPKWHSARPMATSTMTKGYGGCGEGYVTANVQPLFDWAADNGQTTLTTGLRAKAADEGSVDSHAWKKFSSSETSKDPYVSITYNTKPSAPTTLRIGGKACGSGDAAFVTKVPNYPAAQATASDPDGTERPLSVQFFVAKTGSALPSTPTVTSKATTSGSVATVTIPTKFALAENQSYTMYAKATDGLDTSAASATCTFTIDSTGPPIPPTVTSTDYSECLTDSCSPQGGVGSSGRFFLGANGVPDVVSYRYWFEGGGKVDAPADSPGGAAIVRIDPPALTGGVQTINDLKRGGPRLLHVVSVDQAGRESAEYSVNGDGGYRMSVGVAAGPTAWWKLDGGDLADSSGHGNTMTPVGAIASGEGNGDGGTSLSLTGAGSTRASLAVDPSRSSTSSATVKITSFGGRPSIVRHYRLVQIAGSRVDELYVDGATKKYCYRQMASGLTTELKVCSSLVITPGVWNRVVGGFDAMTRQIFISVDGVRASNGTSTPKDRFDWPLPEPSGSNTTIGRGTHNSETESSPLLNGSVDDVRVWDRLLQPAEINMLTVSELGRWNLDGSGADSAAHPVRHPLVPTSQRDDLWNDYGHVEQDWGSARFNGTDALSTSSGDVLRTDQSFSVSAWASPSTMTATHRTVVSLEGTNQSAFTLGVRTYSGAKRWTFSMTDADTATSSPAVRAEGPPLSDADIDGWVHLVGIYDAPARQIRLYVNGQLAMTVARTSRWQASGLLHIGKARYASNGVLSDYEFFEGNVDAVRVYAGVLSSDMVTRLYQTPDGNL